MSDYFLGVDGGATKTIARLGGAGLEPLELRAGPSSLTQSVTEAVANILGLTRQLLVRQRVNAAQVSLTCGVAGAGNPKAAHFLSERLKSEGFANVTVTSDAQTSLIGAGGGLPLVMVAIGTGSVAMRLGRDGGIRQFGGWGLAVGDEGSGAAIGKSAVRGLLWELDIYGEPRSPLSHTIIKLVGHQRADILPWLQRAGSRDYAALAPSVFEHLSGCRMAENIIVKTVGEIEKLIRTASDDDTLPLTILGGLADRLKPFLAEDLKQRCITPLGTALDGACTLARREAVLA